MPERKTDRCPRCDSPDPKKHPAVQFEGEVQVCPHEWHRPPDRPRTDAEIAREVLGVDEVPALYADLVAAGRAEELREADLKWQVEANARILDAAEADKMIATAEQRGEARGLRFALEASGKSCPGGPDCPCSQQEPTRSIAARLREVDDE